MRTLSSNREGFSFLIFIFIFILIFIFIVILIFIPRSAHEDENPKLTRPTAKLG